MADWFAKMEQSYDAKLSGKTADGEDITVLISGRGRSMKQLRKKFKASDDVRVLRQAVVDEEMPGANPSLFFGKKALEDGKCLRFYAMAGKVTVSVSRRLDGGSMLAATAIERPKPRMHVFQAGRHSDLRVGTGSDDLMMVGSAKNPTVVCPCKRHQFIAQTYFMLLKSTIEKDSCSHTVRCPMPGCGIEIPFDFIIKAGDLSTDEVTYYSYHIGSRALDRTTTTCPSCLNRCSLPERLDYVRVRCGCPGGKDFCFQCGKYWVGGGFQVCGNSGCTTESLQLTLKHCDEVELTGGHMCPKVRACPNCLSLIEWQRACKHFTCTGCKCSFCFLCLKPRTECKKDYYKDLCSLAPRQVLK